MQVDIFDAFGRNKLIDKNICIKIGMLISEQPETGIIHINDFPAEVGLKNSFGE